MNNYINNSMSSKAKLAKLQPAFEQSLKNVFETMVFTKVFCGQPEFGQTVSPTGSISGTIGLAGDTFAGRLTLIFEQSVAEQVFRNMTMINPDEEVNEPELKDVIGELANITAGGAKAGFQQDGSGFAISLPVVVVGLKHHVESPQNSVTAVMPVSMGEAVFYLELAIQ